MSDFPWLESYPDFVSPTTEINYKNIVEIYDQSIRISEIMLPIKIWMLNLHTMKLITMLML